MWHFLTQRFSWWAQLSRRAQLVTLGIVVVVVGVGGSLALHRLVPPSMAELTRDMCASVKQPSEPDAQWHILLSTDSAIIASTMRATPGPGVMGKLDTPVLVHPIALHTHYDANDCPHWIASTHDAQGHHHQVFDFVYDYPHHRMRLSGVGFPNEESPVYAHGFPVVPLNTAEGLLRAQRHVEPSNTWTPELVFFGLQDGWSTTPPHEQGAQVWHEGGADPLDPMWLMLGRDGWPYLVGTSQHVYAVTDLPIDR